MVELRSDPRYSGLLEHRPASARVELQPLGPGRARIVVHDFISPSIIERLRGQEGVLSPRIEDWRAMVDNVMIDTSYDGGTFHIALADIPERRADLGEGVYEVALPAGSKVAGRGLTRP